MLAPARTKSTRCSVWAMGTDPTQRSQRAEEGFEQARGVYPSPRMKGTGRLFLQFHPFRFDLFCRPLWRICAIRNGIEAEISFVSCVSPDFPRENPLPFILVHDQRVILKPDGWKAKNVAYRKHNESLSLLSRIDREMFVRFWEN